MKKPLIVITFIFIVFYILGHFGPSFLNGDTCLTFLGCNSGPLGYDAFLHVITGSLYVIAILWFVERNPEKSILTRNFKLNVFIVISVVALFSVGWETIEFIHDNIRLAENPSFPTKELDQPTNADTMGDLLISLTAAAATIPFVKRKLTSSQVQLERPSSS